MSDAEIRLQRRTAVAVTPTSLVMPGADRRAASLDGKGSGRSSQRVSVEHLAPDRRLAGRPVPAADAVNLTIAEFEWRLIADAGCDPADRLAMARELKHFGSAGSFAARRLEELAFATLPWAILLQIEPDFPHPSWDVAAAAILAACRSQVPLPAMWAAAATTCRLHPAGGKLGELFTNIEMRELFAIRYTERYGAGVIGDPLCAATSVAYLPINPSIRAARFERVASIDDALPLADIVGIADGCAAALRTYFSVTNCCQSAGAGSQDGGAVALLPPEVATKVALHKIDGLLEYVSRMGAPASVSRQELFNIFWPCPEAFQTLATVRTLRTILAERGWGFEPDPEFGRWPRLPQVFAFFPVGEESDDHAWKRAAILVGSDIGRVVGRPIEFARAMAKLVGADIERDMRLAALVETCGGTTALTLIHEQSDSRIERFVADLLRHVTAGQLGIRLTPSQIATLGPVLRRYRIAVEPSHRTSDGHKLVLRKQLVATIEAQDRLNEPLLAGLSDHIDEPAATATPVNAASRDEWALALIVRLPADASLPASAFATLCRTAGKTSSVAFEAINTRSADICGEALLHPGDPIAIDQDVLNHIKGKRSK